MAEDLVNFEKGAFAYKVDGLPIEGIQVKKKYIIGKYANNLEEESEEDEASRDFDADEMAYIAVDLQRVGAAIGGDEEVVV